MKNGWYSCYIKRFLDFILSLAALVFLSPVFAVVAFLVRIKLGSPIIFIQKRPGLNGKIFSMYKFRTMTNKTNSRGELLPDEVRLTKFGKLLRSTSLDELPELVNILKGDMSLVGPRPLLVEYLELYNREQKQRHDVRPGLTGLAQINGRNAISWEEKFELDTEYIQKISFVYDCLIIYDTVKKVLKREGISAENNATAEPFKGTNLIKKKQK